MSKTEADNLLTISIYWLRRQGFLHGYKSGTITWTSGFAETKSSIGITIDLLDYPHAKLRYTQTDSWTGEKKEFDYKISLTSTPCYFGGKRWWFVCPLTVNGVYCGRRVGTLYKDNSYFGCRHCYDLTYRSRNENRHSGWYGYFKILDMSQKAEELEEKIKRRKYAGKPTKMQLKLYKLYARSSGIYNIIDPRKLR